MSDRNDFYFGQNVRESDLDAAFGYAESSDRSMVADSGLVGVHNGLVVSEHSPASNYVDVSAGAAYDALGRRVAIPEGSLVTVDLANDTAGAPTTVTAAGYKKIISVFIQFTRAESDLRTDAGGLDVYFLKEESYKFVVIQSAEGLDPTPPTFVDLDPTEVAILLADVERNEAQTIFETAHIDISRRDDAFLLTGTPVNAEVANTTRGKGQPEQAAQFLLDAINDHLTGTANKHPAAAVTYAGGGAWADATSLTGSPTDVEAALDALLTDLGGSTGVDKIGAVANTTDTLQLLTTTLKGQIDEIVVHLNTLNLGNEASGVPYDGATAVWADGTAFPAGNVDGALDRIVSELGGANGAAKIGAAAYSPAGAYQLATTSASGQIKESLDHLNALVAALADTTAATSGVEDVGAEGYTGAALTLPAGTLKAQLEFIADNAGIVGGADAIALQTKPLDSTTVGDPQPDDVILWNDTLSRYVAGPCNAAELQGTAVAAGGADGNQLVLVAGVWTPTAPSGSAVPAGPANEPGSDLGGVYPIPTIAKLQGNTLALSTLGGGDTGKVLTWSGTQWEAVAGGSGGIEGIPAGGDLTGTYASPIVNKLQQRAVSDHEPEANEVLTWDGAGYWIAKPAPGGGGGPPTGDAGGDLTGDYPNPGVGQIQGVTWPSSPPDPGYGIYYKSFAAGWMATPGRVCGKHSSGTPGSAQILKYSTASGGYWYPADETIQGITGGAGIDVYGVFNKTVAIKEDQGRTWTANHNFTAGMTASFMICTSGLMQISNGVIQESYFGAFSVTPETGWSQIGGGVNFRLQHAHAGYATAFMVLEQSSPAQGNAGIGTLYPFQKRKTGMGWFAYTTGQVADKHTGHGTSVPGHAHTGGNALTTFGASQVTFASVVGYVNTTG